MNSKINYPKYIRKHVGELNAGDVFVIDKDPYMVSKNLPFCVEVSPDTVVVMNLSTGFLHGFDKDVTVVVPVSYNLEINL